MSRNERSRTERSISKRSGNDRSRNHPPPGERTKLPSSPLTPKPASAVRSKSKAGQPKKTDLRIRRTQARLSNALVELMRDKPIDQVTVQEVLDHAGVGRSTFYLHYRDKDDLFLDLMENGMKMWSTLLVEKQEKSTRLAPVEEFFAHAATAINFYRALIDSGRIQAFFDLAQGCFARGIARRLEEMQEITVGSPNLRPKNLAVAQLAAKVSGQMKPRSTDSAGRELDARSHALAGNLLSLLKWWLDRGTKESPRAMDQLFHQIAWKGLQ
jgi:AcrR family transcriptional regulator